MDTLFMDYRNIKTSDLHRLLLNLSDKINPNRSNKYVALSNLSINQIWKNLKKSYKNNKFKISALTWNEVFELTDVSFSESAFQGFFKMFFLKSLRKD